MTSNFDNDYLASPTMREFIRITEANKPSPGIQKVAAIQDPEPTTFAESLLLLTAKLRSNGFAKHASELEQRFLLLKKAERHLYNTHDESGEDLIDYAHPGGGNKKLDKGWDELGDIETIVERHQKMLDVVNKEPAKHKKEAGISAASIARIILAQGADSLTEDQLQQKIQRKRDAIKALLAKLDSRVKELGGISGFVAGQYYMMVSDVDSILGAHVNLNALHHLQKFVGVLKDTVGAYVNKDEIRELAPYYERIQRMIVDLIADVSALNNKEMGTIFPEGGDAAHETGPATPKSLNTDIAGSVAAFVGTANTFLTKLKDFESKAAANPTNLAILRQTEQSLTAFAADLGALGQLVLTGAPFADAANKAGSGTFKGIKDGIGLAQEVEGYFNQVKGLIDHMNSWK